MYRKLLFPVAFLITICFAGSLSSQSKKLILEDIYTN